MSATGQIPRTGFAAPRSDHGTGPAGLPRRLDMEIRATPEAVLEVRHALAGLGVPQPLLHEAQLLASEVVTNSVRHAGLTPGERVHVNAEWTGSTLRVDVYDGGRVLTDRDIAGAIRPSPGSESGWGLYLVDRLAARWGRGNGRHWFELEAGSS